MVVLERVDARERRLAADAACELARQAAVLIASRGRSSTRYEMRGAVAEDELRRGILGPTGNLRAPTARVGDVLLVGFEPRAWSATLGIATSRRRD